MSKVIVDLQDISFMLLGMEKPILSNINYQMKRGDFVVLLGSNGSGKSSLLKILDRRYCATSGELKITGKKINEYRASEFCHVVTTLTQNCLNSLFSSLTVLDNCILVQQHSVKKLLRISTKTERQFFSQYLLQFNVRLANKLDTVVSALSGGEQQALSLALGVLQQPKVLLLDEHTSALDPHSAERLMAITAQVVTERNIMCVLATHDLAIALRYGSRILALRDGKIFCCIEQEQKQKLTQKDLLRLCY